jgi:hypothetical protein
MVVVNLLENFPGLVFSQVRPNASHVVGTPNGGDTVMFGELFADKAVDVNGFAGVDSCVVHGCLR